jgi:2-keto-3-deoxy-6-phosphogluconate aldolase
MVSKIENLKRIAETGIAAVVRAENPDQTIKIAEAVKKGGIQAIEITMTVPGAIDDVIKKLTETYSNNEILIGAGSVLDAETTRYCILAGAECIVGLALAEWIKAGSFAVGVGDALAAGAKRGDYEEVTKTAKEFIKRTKTAREKL